MNFEVDKYSVRAVDRALSIIRCLADEPTPLSIDQICARVGLPKTTTFRVLATLEARGFVVRDETEHTYCFGELAQKVGEKALASAQAH